MQKILLSVITLLFVTEIAAQQPKILIQDGVFKDENGDCFVPFGYNYVGSKFQALLEDNWLSDSAWAVIEGDFQEIKTYNANSVRIHLQYHEFMDGASTPNLVAFDRLSQLVELAESQQLYLLITGLSAYRASDQPAWYDALNEQGRWATQALFWGKVAEVVGTSKAVFAYDLMNEPVMLDTTTWLPGGTFGGFNFVQNLTLNPNGRNFKQIVNAWSQQMTEAIRTNDPVTPITIGFIGCGPIKDLSSNLDFTSAHIYPQPDSEPNTVCNMRLTTMINLVNNSQDNKPFVVSEIASLFSFEETEKFMEVTCPKVNGWFNHYGGITLEEFSDTSILDALHKYNLRTFKAKYSQLHQCQTPCGTDVACKEAQEPDPNLVASYAFSGNGDDGSGFNHNLLNTNTTPTTGQDGTPNTALDFQPNDPAYLIAPDAKPLQFRYDRSFTLVAKVFPRWVNNSTIWVYDDKDNLDGDAPDTRDVVRLEINNLGLFDGQLGGDSVFYFTFSYGKDNSTFFTPIARISSKCFKFDQWYTIIAVYDTGKDSTFLYVNGHLQDYIGHSLDSPWNCSGQYPMIGRNNAYGTFFAGFFNGRMDYIKVFDRALAKEEVVLCSVLENEVTCTLATETNDLRPEQILQVYPNPAEDHISMNLPFNTGPIQVNITDITGKSTYVSASHIVQNILTVPTSGLPSGCYQICVTDASGRRFVGRFLL